jgi:spore coat polysaccharide biosynthesis predicted glycosyltransferase SpsG
MKHTPKIIIRCDAGRSTGFGHVVRCLALATRLKTDAGVQALFAMQRDDIGNQFVRGHGFSVTTFDSEHAIEQSEDDWLARVLLDNEAECLVLDVRTQLSKAMLLSVRSKGLFVVTIDDLSDRSAAVDQIYLPPIPQVKRLTWDGFTGERFVGWDWILMPERVVAHRAREELLQEPEALRLVVTMGGSDPAELTLRVVEILKTISIRVEIAVLIGPAYLSVNKLESLLQTMPWPTKIFVNPHNFLEILGSASLVIGSFGATAYEVAALGVPSVYLCLSADHAESASALQDAGCAISLGIHDEIKNSEIRDAIVSTLESCEIRQNMRTHSLNKIDGRGCQRISHNILSALHI